MDKNIVLVRHGQTNFNIEKRFQGWANEESFLTEKGHEQSKLLGTKLKNLKFVFNKIYSSDLRRARETTEDIKLSIGSIPVDYLEILRERGYGNVEKKKWDDLNIEVFSIEKIYLLDRKHKQGIFANAESLDNLHLRIKKSIQMIHNSKSSNILIVGHETFNSLIINTLLKEAPIPHKQDNANYHYFKLDNSGEVLSYKLNN